MADLKDPYGPLRKSRWLFLIFAGPALAMMGVGLGLAWQDTGSIRAAFGSGLFLLMTLLGLAGLIWGGVFTSKPIALLTPEGLVGPNGRRVSWAEVASAKAGQTTTAVVSANTGPRTVVHEVVWLRHHDGDSTEIVTTWAKIGPEAANNRILAAFQHSKP